MASSAAHKLANARYRQNKRKTIGAEVSKEKGESFQAFAANIGISTSNLVQRAIEEYIAKHENGAPMPAQNSQPTLSAEQKKLVDEFSKLPVDAQKHFIKAFQAINNIQICPSYAPDKPTSND